MQVASINWSPPATEMYPERSDPREHWLDVFERVATAAPALLAQRLRRLSKGAIRSYKDYMRDVGVPLRDMKSPAVSANVEMFADTENLRAIGDYVRHGVFPWEKP